MAKRSIADLDVVGKRVLVRVDFNVPIEQGIDAIAGYDHRLRATLPTIEYLLERDCRVILCSHLGRPGGKIDEAVRLGPVGDRLATLLGRPVSNLRDCIGPDIARAIDGMEARDVALLENLRFHEGEEKADLEFTRALGSLADCFVMDAFAVAHRGPRLHSWLTAASTLRYGAAGAAGGGVDGPGLGISPATAGRPDGWSQGQR